ncbi:MAG: orotate phosphoribosyltransferase [Candidatus Bathyarchaeia archaeon]
MNEKLKIDFCKTLIKIGAIKFGVFTLTSGKLSPYYIDLRLIPSFPDAFQLAMNVYEDIALNEIKLNKFDRIAGIPTAGIPFASVLSYRLKKPFIYVRKGVKTHGRERRVEGMLLPGNKILIVDDLITTGKSTLEAANSIIAEGGSVEDVLVLIDRQEGGRSNLKKAKIELHNFIKVSEIAKILLETNAIDEEKYNEVINQCIE